MSPTFLHMLPRQPDWRWAWWICASCVASAYAVAPSDRTFAATAALIGIATFAFTRDIASRSVISPPISASSSALLSCPDVRLSSVTLLSFRRLLGVLRGLFSKLVVGALAVGQLLAALLSDLLVLACALGARDGRGRARLVHVHRHGDFTPSFFTPPRTRMAARFPRPFRPKRRSTTVDRSSFRFDSAGLRPSRRA